MKNKSSIPMAMLLAVALIVQHAEAQLRNLAACDVQHARCILSCSQYHLASCGPACFRDELEAPALLPRLRSCRTTCARDKAQCYERMLPAGGSIRKCFQECVEEKIQGHENCLRVAQGMLEEERGTTEAIPVKIVHGLVQKLISCATEYALDSARCNCACILT